MNERILRIFLTIYVFIYWLYCVYFNNIHYEYFKFQKTSFNSDKFPDDDKLDFIFYMIETNQGFYNKET